MLPTHPFGHTGHESTRVIFGAAALGSMGQDRADATLELIESYGVNHIDTARGYGDSELRLEPWLATNRDKVFLATKTGEREVAFAPGGAVEALAKARDEGLCRFLGVTGHGLRIPSMHLRSLHAFDFDSVLFPYNFVLLERPDYRADVEALLDLCAQRSVAAQTIKSIARGRWSGSREGKFSWYETLTDPAAIGRAVRYVLGNDQLFLNTTSDATLLPTILGTVAAGDLVAPPSEELQADVDHFGITTLFDGNELERI